MIRRVHGAQAKEAVTLGLVKVTRNSAKELWEKGIPLIFVGNQVNTFHFFGGWGLAFRVDPATVQDSTFDAYVNNYAFYLDDELGKPSFFVESKHL